MRPITTVNVRSPSEEPSRESALRHDAPGPPNGEFQAGRWRQQTTEAV